MAARCDGPPPDEHEQPRGAETREDKWRRVGEDGRAAARRRRTTADTKPERPVRWVRQQEAYQYMGIGRTTLHRLETSGRLPPAARCDPSPGTALYDLDVIDQWLATQPLRRRRKSRPR